MNDQRFLFVHLQKTAGTSLIRRLRHCFGRAAVYPDFPTDGQNWIKAIIDPDYLLERWRARGDEIRVVTGHFPMCTAELLDGDFATLTVLRDPVARTLSYLRHHREMTPKDADLTLEEVYDDPFRFHGLVHNHMTKMFSLSVEEMDAGPLTRVEFTPERLERAKQNLARIDAIGLQEDFEAFCDEASGRFGWDLGKSMHVNRTEPTPVASALVDRITEDNAMDIELYEYGQRLVNERHLASEKGAR